MFLWLFYSIGSFFSFRIVLKAIGYSYISLTDNTVQQVSGDSERALIAGETLALPAGRHC